MLTNPLTTPWSAPALMIVGGLLIGVLALLLVVERRHGWALVRRPLFQKWSSWALITPIYLLAVLAGPLTITLLAMAISIQCLREYGRLTALPAAYRWPLLVAGGVAGPIALVSTEALLALPPLVVLLATLPALLSPRPEGLRPLLTAVFGWAYLGLLPAFLVVLGRAPEAGPGLLLAIGLAVALSDVGAFTCGRLFGRHPLAPLLSPHKTWEGVVGNLAGALLGLLALSAIWPSGLSLPLALGLALLIGLGCVWGDLIESAVKRTWGVKDAGSWLPGFGGLLDRVDSLVVVVPLLAYALRLIRL